MLHKLLDNFFAVHVSGDVDVLLENRRKTEFLGTLMRYNSNVRANFTDR